MFIFQSQHKERENNKLVIHLLFMTWQFVYHYNAIRHLSLSIQDKYVYVCVCACVTIE